MDVAFGTTDVPLPRKFLRNFYLIIFFLIQIFRIQYAFALTENSPIHFSGDKQVWDRKNNTIELFGHAAVSQPGETLMADYIRLDQNTRLLDAKGNCVHMTGDMNIWGAEMHFNMNTRTGTVVGGRVSNDRFTLRGEMIQKVGPGHFKTEWGEYSTCRDCSTSWSLLAGTVDMETNGYASMTNVTVKIKGAPAAWMPFLVIPIKTDRQSGFTFPTAGASGDNGFKFLLPYFWAADRSWDMTFWAGIYTRRGPRIQWETRYVLSDDNKLTSQAYYQFDRTFAEGRHRWAINIFQSHLLPFNIQEKFRMTEVGDNLYPFIFGDVPGSGEAFMPTTLSFTKNTENFSTFLSFQRYRALLNSTPGDLNAQKLGFDPRTVQVLPQIQINSNDRPLWNTGFTGGLSVGFWNFTRTAGPFDFDTKTVPFGTPVPQAIPNFTAGQDPIRKAMRISVIPTLYTTLRVGDAVSLVPSFTYRGYFYNFYDLAPPLARGYLLFQTDLITQFEKVYEFSKEAEYNKMKHLIRPLLRYSLIPVISQDSSHPFARQIENGLNRGISGYNFDNYDIIPYTYTPSNTNYFWPLGHSLTYGLTMQWIRKKTLTGSYEKIINWTAGQSINFIEMTNPVDPATPHIFTRFVSGLSLTFEKFSASANYFYDPGIADASKRQSISTTGTFVIERGTRQSILSFDRSVNFTYNFSQVGSPVSNLSAGITYSINDYLMPSMDISYDFITNKVFNTNAGIKIQSPSRCWWVSGGVGYRTETQQFTFRFDWQLNLTGGGFGTLSDVANSVVRTN